MQVGRELEGYIGLSTGRRVIRKFVVDEFSSRQAQAYLHMHNLEPRTDLS
jgi:hypothetical protein